MQKETKTFDKLPEAVSYLTEQIIELKRCRNFNRLHQTSTYWSKLRPLAASIRKVKSTILKNLDV